MATTKKSTTKKEVEKKQPKKITTTKKTTAKKPAVKKTTTKKVEVVEEVKVKKENKTLTKIKEFFNKPAPLIIVLIGIICFLLLYISRTTVKDVIFVGKVDKKDIQIGDVHYFTNGDMNFFYATPAIYLGEDKEVYSYNMGYYVVDENNEYIEFAARTGSAKTPAKLSEIIDESSGWRIPEFSKNEYFFTKDVLDNLDNLHFVVKAATEKDATTADIVIDYEVELIKITK